MSLSSEDDYALLCILIICKHYTIKKKGSGVLNGRTQSILLAGDDY